MNPRSSLRSRVLSTKGKTYQKSLTSCSPPGSNCVQRWCLLPLLSGQAGRGLAGKEGKGLVKKVADACLYSTDAKPAPFVKQILTSHNRNDFACFVQETRGKLRPYRG